MLEFISKLSVPKNQSKWTSRLKCNVYYYRTNYLVLLVLCAAGMLMRNPLALLGVLSLLLALASFNDPFTTGMK